MGKFAIVLVSTLIVFIFTYTLALRNVYLEADTRVSRAYSLNQANNIAQSALMTAIRGIGSHTGLDPFFAMSDLPDEGNTISSGNLDWPGLQGSFNLEVTTVNGDPSGMAPIILEITATGMMDGYAYTSTIRGEYTPEDVPFTFDGYNRDYAIYSRNQIIMGGGSVNGPVGTNASMNGAVTLDWGAAINGDIQVGPGADSDEAVQTPAWGDHLHSGSVSVMPQEIEYDMPPFPEFPTNTTSHTSQHPSHSAGNPHLQLNIPSGTPLHIESIFLEQNTQLTVHLQGNGPHQIVVDNFDMPQGHFNINTQGSDDKKLQIFVNDSFTFGGSGGDSSINKNGNDENLELYYSGSDQVFFNQGTDYKGLMHINNPEVNVNMTGGATFAGMLVVNGGDINIAGGLNASPSAIHAPNSKITLSGGAQVVGSITGDSVIFQDGGNASVTFDDGFMDPGIEEEEEDENNHLAFRIIQWQ